jgi:phenylpropionate dioxygenase-like ring-hydroxylating dioxygenase large terminal subunit
MLTEEDNDIVCHVGPGTLLGNLLRRYWTPALLSDEVPTPDCNPVKVRILGEDLVAFRDSDGRVGLMDSCCPHRGSGMFFGRNEENGLRCVYHGWKFDYSGQCTDMPSEPADSNYKDRLRIPAYPTHESGGLVWAYMGPRDKMTPFRDFGTEDLPQEQWRARKNLQPITWMQRLEGSFDTTHTSWLHMFGAAQFLDADADGSDHPGVYNSSTALWKYWWYDRSPRVEVKEDWFGFRGVGLRKTPNGNTHARLYHWCIPYGAGGSFSVPMDDENTWQFNFNTVWTAGRNALFEGRETNLNIPQIATSGDRSQAPVRNLANDFLIDREAQRNGTIYSGIGVGALGNNGFTDQDVMARQTAYLDRTKEHLGTLDRKIILLRRILLRAAKDVARGLEPPALEGSLPYDKIEWPDKMLNPGEDWTRVGTEIDPDYQKVYGIAQPIPASTA